LELIRSTPEICIDSNRVPNRRIGVGEGLPGHSMHEDEGQVVACALMRSLLVTPEKLRLAQLTRILEATTLVKLLGVY